MMCARTAAAVILLTARDELSDRLRGFDAGVDDYVTKPFAVAEIIARLRVVLRRSGAPVSSIEVGDLLVDQTAAVYVDRPTAAGDVFRVTLPAA